jgi:hypothetical protein
MMTKKCSPMVLRETVKEGSAGRTTSEAIIRVLKTTVVTVVT